MGMVIKPNMKYSNHIVAIVIYCDYFLNCSKFFIFFGGPILINVLARSDFLNFSQFFSIFHFCSFFLIFLSFFFYHFFTFYFMLLLFFTSF